MVNITVYQNGDVVGDTGKIIAYEGQSYSSAITIVHPLFSGAKYYVEYTYNNTIFRDQLNSNNQVSLRIEKAGYLKCQFVAIDILSSEILFKSHAWNFLIQSSMSTEPSHYPCSSHIYDNTGYNSFNHSNYKQSMNCNHQHNSIDSYKAYYELLTELRNEEDIRYREIQNIYNDLKLIKDALGIGNNTPSLLDANKVIQAGSYIAAIGSINFPVDQECTLEVANHNGHIIQQCFECDGDNIWFRTGEDDNGNVTWNSWAENITRVNEI